MQVAPRPGFQYRDTNSLALVPPEGFDADPNDLDIARALACGDLVAVTDDLAPASAKKAAPAAAPAKDEG